MVSNGAVSELGEGHSCGYVLGETVSLQRQNNCEQWFIHLLNAVTTVDPVDERNDSRSAGTRLRSMGNKKILIF